MQRKLKNTGSVPSLWLPRSWEALDDGSLDPLNLDDAEVMSGRLRQSDGTLGPKPSSYPAAFLNEQRRRISRDTTGCCGIRQYL